jgi:8-oxo-dGTP pyrophosphatase MutT (NUDIX family)
MTMSVSLHFVNGQYVQKWRDLGPVQCAGVQVVNPDGLMLFVKRADTGQWAFPGGHIEHGETPDEAAARECFEETGYKPDDVKHISTLTTNGVKFHTYRHQADTHFEPRLCNEHTGYAWCDPDFPPKPLHPGIKQKTLDEFDPSKHPHASAGQPTGGQFVHSASGTSGELDVQAPIGTVVKNSEPELNKLVTDVGGDEWNQQTAVRLEKEYVAVKPKLDGVLQRVASDNVKTSLNPESWGEFSENLKAETEKHFKESMHKTYLEQAIKGWQDDNGPKLEATVETVDNPDWMVEPIQKYLDDHPEIPPQSAKHIAASVDLKLDDENAIAEVNVPVGELPMNAVKDLRKILTTGFYDNVDKLMSEVTPPAYLEQNVKDQLNATWNAMSDGSKCFIAKDADLAKAEQVDAPNGLPKKFDPLANMDNLTDYRLTQATAKKMSIERTADVLMERGLAKDVDPDKVKDRIKKMDSYLWTGWKSSSTTEAGQLIQLATADELGSRLYTDHITGGINSLNMKIDADEDYGDIGGYEAVKAYIRAKWETTQYLLDKADQSVLNVYRAVNLDEVRGETGDKLDDVNLKRNGAMSTSVDPDVSNEWNGHVGRVVLRLSVPRTSVLSVPAYGQNEAKEKEVVVTGNAWRGWDAYYGKAPTFEEAPL